MRLKSLLKTVFLPEPSTDETVPARKPRPKGKRAVDLAGIKTTTESYYLNEDILNETFPKGWHQLEDEVYKELKRIPASYEVVEHHIGVYAGNGNDAKIIRGEAPKSLLNHSILTPSLVASVFTAKYVNAVPLNRISEGYGYDGIHISRQVMAGWMIKQHRYYLEPVHRMMKTELFSQIQTMDITRAAAVLLNANVEEATIERLLCKCWDLRPSEAYYFICEGEGECKL